MAVTLLPVLVVGFLSIQQTSERLTETVTTELSNDVRVEMWRIQRQLQADVSQAELLAMGPHVIQFTQQIASPSVPAETIGGFDDFSIIDPNAGAPLQELAERLLRLRGTMSTGVRDVTVLSVDGDVWGTTSDGYWQPTPLELATTAETGVLFGPAFQNIEGDHRVPVIVPIRGGSDVTGFLLVEFDLAPIAENLLDHESFGETKEAHLAQATAEGDAEFITLLRFQRDAAFSLVVPQAAQKPINESLVSPAPRIIFDTDYRSEPSILAVQTVPETGWGLVVKIDEAEALAPAREIRTMLYRGSAIALASIVAGWWLLLRPLTQRLRRAAKAAETVAAGNYREVIGDETPDEIGEMSRSIDQLSAEVAADIDKRAQAEAALRHRAAHDDLTGLFNRHHATTEITKMLAESPDGVALIFLDLDNFKSINDVHGHLIGDDVLHASAERIRNTTPEAVHARWGGDEFIVAMTAEDFDQRAVSALEHAFSQPFATDAGSLTSTASIGLALLPAGATFEELLHLADADMFAHKQTTKQRQLLDPEIVAMVENALADNRIEVWYQPICDLSDEGLKIVAVEALARLRRPDGSIAMPSEFLPSINESALARALDIRVAEIVAEHIHGWINRGIVDRDFEVAINLAPASLQQEGIATQLAEIALRNRLRPKQIVIEISEEANRLPAKLLGSFRAEGFKLALDDLGTKRSNIDRLDTDGIDYAKIDRQWLDDPVLFEALVLSARRRGLYVIAEGVERQGHAELLSSLGVTLGQGFLLGRPQGEQRTRTVLTARRAMALIPNL